METMFPDLQNSPVGDDALQRSMAERLQLSTTVTQVGRIHVHMEVFPSSLLFKQGLNLTFTNDPVSQTSIDKVT